MSSAEDQPGALPLLIVLPTLERTVQPLALRRAPSRRPRDLEEQVTG